MDEVGDDFVDRVAKGLHHSAQRVEAPKKGSRGREVLRAVEQPVDASTLTFLEEAERTRRLPRSPRPRQAYLRQFTEAGPDCRKLRFLPQWQISTVQTLLSP